MRDKKPVESPASSGTPDKCGNKRIYQTWEEAKVRIAELPKIPELYVYKCKECGHLHLTKHNPEVWAKLSSHDDPENWEGMDGAVSASPAAPPCPHCRQNYELGRSSMLQELTPQLMLLKGLADVAVGRVKPLEEIERQLGVASPAAPLKDGEPCSHPGCLAHTSHPCEGCGRINGKGTINVSYGIRVASPAASTTPEHQEHIERLQAMVEDHGEHWDLSERDEQAIAYALKLIGATQGDAPRHRTWTELKAELDAQGDAPAQRPASSAQGDLDLLRKLRVSLDKIEALWPLDFINPMDYAITVDRLAREHRAELDAAIQRKERGE